MISNPYAYSRIEWLILIINTYNVINDLIQPGKLVSGDSL